jgi:hypothetical protein
LASKTSAKPRAVTVRRSLPNISLGRRCVELPFLRCLGIPKTLPSGGGILALRAASKRPSGWSGRTACLQAAVFHRRSHRGLLLRERYTGRTSRRGRHPAEEPLIAEVPSGTCRGLPVAEAQMFAARRQRYHAPHQRCLLQLLASHGYPVPEVSALEIRT